MRREESQPDQVEHDQNNVRKQCATARKINAADMNAQDGRFQNVP
jgi:hypothetical protein